jgi:hypothetical protein
VTARATRIVLLVALAFVVAGCYRSQVALTVNEDGSGTLDVLLAIDPDLVQRAAAQAGQEVDLGPDPCARVQSTVTALDTLPEGTEAEPYTDGNYCGLQVTIPFEDGADLEQLLLDSFGLGATDLPSTFEEFGLERSGDGWRFDASVDAATGAVPGASLFGQYLEGASNRVEVSLPGDVVEHNGDRVEGGVVIWDLAPLGESRTMFASSDTSGGGGDDDDGFPVAWVAVPLLVVVAVGVAVWLWRRSGPRLPPPADAEARGGANPLT